MIFRRTPWELFSERVAELKVGEMAYGREVGVSVSVGAFDIEGRIDFVLVTWRGSQPILRLVEGKASRRDRTYHRLQVATYHLMVRAMLEQGPAYNCGRFRGSRRD